MPTEDRHDIPGANRALGDEDLQRLGEAFVASGRATALLDADLRIVTVNAAGATLLRRRADRLRGLPLRELAVEEDRALVDEAVARAVREGGVADILVRHDAGDGDLRTLRTSVTPVASGGGVVQLEDVTRERRRERALRALAEFDDLTRVRNRRAFRDVVARHLALCGRHGHAGALLVADVDGFKAINDAQGHAAGDHALGRVATAIRDAVRASDVVGRVGGDEFAVLLPQGGPRQAVRVARDLCVAVRRASGADLSIGVAPVVVGVDADGLFRAADRAMYVAKAAGGGRAHLEGPVERRVARGEVPPDPGVERITAGGRAP